MCPSEAESRALRNEADKKELAAFPGVESGYTVDDYILGEDGKPLRLLHGTRRNFERFTMDVLQSAGAHFGCEAQANDFAKGEGGRIFPVYLLSKNRVDVRGSDCGWRYPNQTICTLCLAGALTDDDAIALVGQTRRSLIEAWHADCQIAHNEPRYTAINREMEVCLRKNGIDCVCYSNRNEPDDGKARDAYLILNPSQIVSALTKLPLG